MPSPITASDFEVTAFSGDICERIKKLLEIHNKLQTFFTWMFDDDGTLTTEFLALLGAVVVPTGGILYYPRGSVPSGYLIANGAAVSRTTYAALFSVYGTEFGAGDGSTTFNLPDLQGRFLMGSSGAYAIGTTGGEASHVLTQAELPESRVNLFGATEEGEPVAYPDGDDVIAKRLNVDSEKQSYLMAKDEISVEPSIGVSSKLGSGSAHQNLPPYRAGLWLCRT